MPLYDIIAIYTIKFKFHGNFIISFVIYLAIHDIIKNSLVAIVVYAWPNSYRTVTKYTAYSYMKMCTRFM